MRIHQMHCECNSYGDGGASDSMEQLLNHFIFLLAVWLCMTRRLRKHALAKFSRAACCGAIGVAGVDLDITD
jgi:hypothetical protein